MRGKAMLRERHLLLYQFLMVFLLATFILPNKAHAITGSYDPMDITKLVPDDDSSLNDRIPLILIHGIHGNQDENKNDSISNPQRGYFGNLLNHLYDNGIAGKYKIYRFHYQSDILPVQSIAAGLQGNIDNVPELKDRSFVIVAHSMGGLVARSYMNEWGGGDKVMRLITLATPHHGSPGANEVGRECLSRPDWINLMDIVDLIFWDSFGTATNPASYNRADLRWDNYDNAMTGYLNLNPCYGGNEVNIWLSALNQNTTYDSKIMAYYGYIDPYNDANNGDTNRTWLIDQVNSWFSSAYATLLGYAYEGGEHQKALAASILLSEGMNNYFLYNDGLVPYDSGRFNDHIVADRRPFSGYDHAEMKDGRFINNTYPLFDSIDSDLNEISVKPTVDAFYVNPTSVNLGGIVYVSYTVSETGGTGLKQIELWRANDSGGTPVDWTKIETYTTDGNGPLSRSFADKPTSSGSYWYGIHVVDNVGNWNDEQNSNTSGSPGDFGPVQVTVTVSSDTTPPTVSITSPSLGSTVNGSVTVSVSASDSTGVSKVEFYKDNALQFSDSSSPYSWSWNTTDTSNGTYPISAKAYDMAGNSATSSAISVTVSNSAASGGNNVPNVPSALTQYKSDGVTGMGAGATTSERTIAMKGTVSDPDNDSVSLEVEIKTVGTAFSNSPSSNCASSGFATSGGTAAVTCSGLADGQYKWQARAKDSKGAYSSSWTDAGYAGDSADIIVSAGSLKIGDWVTATANLNVRETAGGTLLKTEASGSSGQILDGPQSAYYNSVLYTWWKITWGDGTTGWAVQDYLSQVINYPPVVTLISPLGGETITVNQPFDIKWSASDSTGTISSISISLSTDGGVSWSYAISSNESNDGVYTWTPTTTYANARIKVEATDSYGDKGSDISDSNFNVAASCTVPSTPTLWEIGTLSETGAYNISWSSVSGISSYTLQESTNSSFTSPIEYSATSQSTSVSGKSTNTYYYRVKANNSCGSSGWSNTVYIPVSINQPPNSPSSPSPADGATNVSRTTTLSWSGGDAEGAVTYAVRFGTTSNPPSYAGYGTVTGSSYQVPFTLEPGTTYYWGIYTKDSKGIVTEGPVWRFTTEYSYADLVPTSLTITGMAAPDAQVTLNLTVKNNGSFTAPGAQAFFYLSSTSGGKEQKLNNNGAIIPQLAPGEEATISQTVTLSSLKAGQSYIDAWIDTQSYFTEGDMNNNTFSYSVNYQDAYAPVISYLGLSWGTLFKPGQEYCIVYEVTDDLSVTKLDFYYSTDNGVTWKTITTGFVPGSNGYSNGYLWTIPSDVPITDQLKIKMTAWDGSVNSAEKIAGPYTTISGVVPTVTILSPNGGEVLDLGSTQTITWSVNASNGIGNMDIWLYYGNTSDHIADIRNNTSGSYTWTVPNSSTYVTTSARIKIDVTDLNGNESEDSSDNYFTISDASAPPPAPWTTPEVITSVPSTNWSYTTKGHSSPVVMTDKLGNVHMVYIYTQDDISGLVNNTSPARVITQQILYKKLINGVWTTPEPVYSSTQNTDGGLSGYHGFYNLQLTVDSSNYPHVVWEDGLYDGAITNRNQNDIYYTYYNGSSWMVPTNISTNTINGSETVSDMPKMAIDPSNNVHVVWRDGYSWNSDYTRTGEYNIYYKRKDASGNWSSVSQLTTGYATLPSLVSDANGSIHLGYMTYSPSKGIAYLKWNGSSWSSPAIVSSMVEGMIDIAVDRNNNPYAAWYYYDSSLSEAQILYSYYDGMNWLTPEKISNASDGSPFRPSIVVDSLNRPHVIYEESQTLRLLYKYKDATGWSGPVQPNLSSQSVAGYSSDMAISPDDHLHIVWQSWYNSNGEVFYNHADVGGTDISAPTISVTSPSAGSAVSTGTVNNITWTASDNVGVSSVSLDYTTDGGTTYTSIATGEANDGVYEWAAPNITSSNVQIRVIAVDAEGNQGVGLSGAFSISDKATPSATLTYPNGGEALETGSVQTITWTASDNVGVSSVDLLYSIDGGNNWISIASGQTNSGTYTWTVPYNLSANCLVKVVAYDSDGQLASDTSNGTFSILSSNTAPLVPYSPLPVDKETSISLQPTLTWTGGDIDIGDSVTYTVYLGTSSEPSIVSNSQTSTTYSPGQLAALTTYYWKVVASDGKASSESPVWSFTTGTEAIATPTNLAFSSVTATEVSLSWADNSNNETGYVVERKTGTNGSYSQIAALSANSTSYTDQGLNGNTTYIYRIRAYNADTVSAYSAELMVTTANNAPNTPASPVPASTIGSQSVNTILSWTGGDPDYSDTVTYDVYFGISSNPPLISSGQTETYFSPGTLSYSSVYYWRVDATDNHGNISVGPTWYFVTELPDTIPPTVTINNVSTSTNTTSQTITGTVEAGATVNVATDTAASNGAATVTDTTWSYTITGLEEGANNITVTATDAAGNTAMATAVVVLDTIVPVLTLSTLSNNSVTNNNTLNISGTATDNTGVQGLTINGNPVTINADGSFSHALILNEGANVITTVATDLTGNQTTDTRTITLDIMAPALVINTPADNSKTAASIATVTGTIDENSTVAVILNGGTPQYASVTGNTFTLDAVLASGINTIEVTATDLAGNTSTQKRTATFNTDKPSLAITDPAQDIKTNQGSAIIKGTVSDTLTAVSVSVTVDGNIYNPAVSNGQFEQTVTFTTEKTYTITVTATDEVGNTTTVQRNIIYDITQPAIDFTVTTPTNNTSQTITGTMEEGATVTVTSATASIGTMTYPSTTTWSVNVTGMTEGSNTITATATDAAGNETTVAKEIVVDIIAPDTAITSQPATLTNSVSASFSFTSTETGSTFECQLDSGGYSTCTSPKSYNSLSAGSHTFYVKTTDPAGSTDATPASYSWIIDTTVPAFSSTSPSSNSFINTVTVGYSLSKDVSSGNITFTRTGGNADSLVHAYNFTTSDITAGSHSVNTGLSLVNGAIYTVTFEATDAAGNTGSVSSTNVTYDTSSASVTIISPAANSVTNNAKVSYTLSEGISVGDIVFTGTGGASDSMSPYTYTLSASERTTGNHAVDTGKTLMDGTIYTVSFENIKDIAGNSTAAVSNTNVTYDSTSVAITGTSPASNSIITTATVSYTLSEQAQSGKITFTWSGGTADGASPHIYAMTSSGLTAGGHTIDTGLTLTDGAFYTVTFEATDLIGNPATTVSNAMVYYDSGYGTGPVGNVDSSGASAMRVDGFDLIKLSLAFGSRPGDANWNPACDLDGNGVIEGNDLIVLGSHFGEVQ